MYVVYAAIFVDWQLASSIFRVVALARVRVEYAVYVRRVGYVATYCSFRDTWRSHLNFPWESYVSSASRQLSLFSLCLSSPLFPSRAIFAMSSSSSVCNPVSLATILPFPFFPFALSPVFFFSLSRACTALERFPGVQRSNVGADCGKKKMRCAVPSSRPLVYIKIIEREQIPSGCRLEFLFSSYFNFFPFVCQIRRYDDAIRDHYRISFLIFRLFSKRDQRFTITTD